MSDIKFVDRQYSINLATQFGEYLYNRLPKVYRDYDVEIERLNVETQKKETFKTLQEYLYSFALGGFQPLLEDLEAIINLVDPFKCPSEFLPYLLRHFGLDYIDDIPEKFQRRLVQNVVTLYKKKGTIPAVAFLAKELSGFDVKIEEKSDGSIEFALIKLNAYEDEDAELLLAQDVIQRYIHLFLPAQTKSKIIVVYGFTENIHINPNGKSEDTMYDHAYYDVDEYEDITYIDENGYDSKTGGYSEAFDYLKHVVEDDFNALKLKLEEETHNFSPSLPDLTSLTNCVENDGLPMFTNGISCEDTITENKLTSSTGNIEVNTSTSSSNIAVNKLVGGGDYAVLPIYKCTTDLLKGTTLEFKYAGKSYGYYTLERDLYASEKYPTTFQLDIYNNMVRIYNHYFIETIDETYDFTLFTGYDNFYTSIRNGSIWDTTVNSIRVKCDYPTEFKKVPSSIYTKPTNTPTIIFRSNYVHLSLANVLTSVESTKEFVKKYPITIIAPAYLYGFSPYSAPCGKTISYKRLSKIPVDGSTLIECKTYTMSDRKTVFAYESPIFTQNSNITIKDISGDGVTYDFGIPLVSFGGYSESIEKVDGKYYLRSAIKEISLEDMYDNLVVGSYEGHDYSSCNDWLSVRGSSFSEFTPYYFNMSPCKSDVERICTEVYDEKEGDYVSLPNKDDIFDFISLFKNEESSNPYGDDCVTIAVNSRFRFWSGEYLDMDMEYFRRVFNDMFKYSDVPPKFYIYDKYNKYGGETLTEITDKEVINKLNLLPIPEDYAIISSKGIKYSSMDISVQSKRYY